MSCYSDLFAPVATGLLALCAPPKSWGGAPVVASPWAGAIGQAPVEKAGRAFEAFCRGQVARAGGVAAAAAAAADGAVDGEKKKKVAKKDRIKWHTIDDDIDEDDYYALLCLTDKSMIPSEDDMRARYRKLSIIYHPDKVAQEKRAASEKRFLLIQKAYETLIDRDKRRIYESRLDFDDDIPNPKKVPDGKFFDIYGPVFGRNARYAFYFFIFFKLTPHHHHHYFRSLAFMCFTYLCLDVVYVQIFVSRARSRPRCPRGPN